MRIRATRAKLSDILIRAGLLDAEGLTRALDRQRSQPGRLGSQLLTMGLVTEEDLAKALSIQYGVPPFLPSLSEVEAEAVRRLPQPVARRCRAFPFSWDPERGVLHVVMADPQDLRGVDEVRFASGARKVAVQVAPETLVDRLISRHYDGVETPPAAPPEIAVSLPASVTLLPSGVPKEADRGSGAATAKNRRDVLLADPDSRRRRAMAGLLESSGFRVTRAASAEEAAELAQRRPWFSVWAHPDWAPSVPGTTALHVYADPIAALADASGPLDSLRREALGTAEVAASRLLGAGLSSARKAVSLVGFLAARRGIEGLAADNLALAAWREALCDWNGETSLQPLVGSEIVTAVAAYERALLAGSSPARAAEELRTDASLDADAVTSLLRWVVGEDLLSRFAAPPRVLVVLPTDLGERFAPHLRGAGWQVTVGDEGSALDGPEGSWDAVLSTAGPGLSFLETTAKFPPEKKPPIFLAVENLNSPDTMYALKLGAEDVIPLDTHPEVLETKLRRAASRRSTTQGVVTGNLRDMGLADMLQILSNGLKTAVVRISGPGEEGEVALEKGAMVDARAGGRDGEEALYHMIAWDAGDFRILPGEPARAATLSGSTDGLLMEAFRRLDELRRGDASGEIPEL